MSRLSCRAGTRQEEAVGIYQTPEELGLRPDLACLSSAVRNLIRYGSRYGHAGCSEAAAAVCEAMFRADFGIDEVFLTLSDPNNAISEAFFEEDGEQAEAYLAQTISEACEAVNRSENGDE